MKTLKLIEPTTELEEQYIQMIHDWDSTDEPKVPFQLNFDYSDFQSMVSILFERKKGIGIPDTHVPVSTFWLIDQQNEILGVVNIKHRLTESLMLDGGHIGYGIRPSKRKKGYATKILELALKEAKKLNIEKALITCDKDNLASSKTILNNNGILDEEYIHEGVSKQRYWINVTQ